MGIEALMNSLVIKLALYNNNSLGRVIESNETTIGDNYSAHKIVFTFPEEPRNLDAKFKEMKVWTLNGSQGYIIQLFHSSLMLMTIICLSHRQLLIRLG